VGLFVYQRFSVDIPVGICSCKWLRNS